MLLPPAGGFLLQPPEEGKFLRLDYKIMIKTIQTNYMTIVK